MNQERGLPIGWRYSWISWYPFKGNPQEIWNPYPQQVLKLIPCKVRTYLPGFIQSYSSQGFITGLSSANCHGKSPSAKFFLSPAEFIKVPQHNLSTQSPTEFIIVIPRGVYHCHPLRSLSLLSPAESIIEILSGALVKFQQSISSHRVFPSK